MRIKAAFYLTDYSLYGAAYSEHEFLRFWNLGVSCIYYEFETMSADGHQTKRKRSRSMAGVKRKIGE